MQLRNAFLLLIIALQLGCFAQNNDLFNVKNASKWTVFLSDKTKPANSVFDISNGILKVSSSGVGYIRTNKMYKNYQLQLEWRWTSKPGNSGVLLHIQKPDSVWPKCFQVQQRADAAGDLICMNGLWATECTDTVKFTIPKMLPSNEKPVGEWNTMKVISKNGTLVVYINNLLQNKVTGLTKVKGYIGLQGEGRDMEFRKMVIKK